MILEGPVLLFLSRSSFFVTTKAPVLESGSEEQIATIHNYEFLLREYGTSPSDSRKSPETLSVPDRSLICIIHLDSSDTSISGRTRIRTSSRRPENLLGSVLIFNLNSLLGMTSASSSSSSMSSSPSVCTPVSFVDRLDAGPSVRDLRGGGVGARTGVGVGTCGGGGGGGGGGAGGAPPLNRYGLSMISSSQQLLPWSSDSSDDGFRRLLRRRSMVTQYID